MSIGYLHLVLIFTVALVFILVQFFARRPWLLRPTGLQGLVDQADPRQRELYHEYLVPLLVYEEDYPAFGNILGLVLLKFPLDRFLEDEQFREALTRLRDSVFQDSSTKDEMGTMCEIVNTFVKNPDVEYECRTHLHRLVSQFLREVER